MNEVDGVEQLIDRVNRLLESMQKSRRWLALRIGVNPNTLANLWREQRGYPRVDTVFRIASVLGTSAEYLMTGRSSGSKSTMEEELIRSAWRHLDEGSRDELLAVLTLKLSGSARDAPGLSRAELLQQLSKSLHSAEYAAESDGADRRHGSNRTHGGHTRTEQSATYPAPADDGAVEPGP